MTLRRLFALYALVLTLLGLGMAENAASAEDSRSIRDFTPCDGRADDTVGTQAAFQAAAHNAFIIVVDCPLTLRIGDDIARPIFVESGTRVIFNDNGQLFVNNSGIPAFVIANTYDVHFLGWRILYTGQTSLQRIANGYHRNGQWVSERNMVASAFNDRVLTPWMSRNRNVVMTNGHDLWNGPSNSTAIFFFTGDDGNIEVRDMAVSAYDFSDPSRYVPMVFSFTTGFPSGTIAPAANGPKIDRPAVPHDMVFDHIDLDGTLMGFQGTVRNATFSYIRSHRYSDLQGRDGLFPGGEEKWFAPPHLFYINATAVGPHVIQSEHVRIYDVVDDGIRAAGTARDVNDSNRSGNALSLKIGGNDILVDTYTSHRPDGFLDVLSSNGLTIRNAEASYDSGFLNDLYPGIRFPAGAPGYKNVVLENIRLSDSAPVTLVFPISNNSFPGNSRVVFRNVSVKLNAWAGNGPLTAPVLAGAGNNTSVSYLIGQSNP
jgi:hypothetical protein